VGLRLAVAKSKQEWRCRRARQKKPASRRSRREENRGIEGRKSDLFSTDLQDVSKRLDDLAMSTNVAKMLPPGSGELPTSA
jgi:hypothetical protein